VVLSIKIIWIIVQTSILVIVDSATPQPAFYNLDQLQPGQGCSVIYDTDGIHMLGGNNEDYFNPSTKVWFIPREEGSYGKVYFGFNDYRAQGGMNDQGLFFDALGLDDVYIIDTTGKQQYQANLADKIMSECATVDCAIQNFEKYFTVPYWTWQFFFGDASGESAIIEPQSIIRQRGGHQVATNFLQSITPSEEFTDPRYRTAMEKLENTAEPGVDSMRDILDAVHIEGEAMTLLLRCVRFES
jgi:hypothetical protein